MSPYLREGDLVAYLHPAWGEVRGVVLDEHPVEGRVLVLDMSPTGARERWPVADLRLLGRVADLPDEPAGGRTVTVRAQPGDEPCPECDGTGEDGGQEGDEFVRAGQCAWCHGSGRRLRPIPVQVLVAALGGGR